MVGRGDEVQSLLAGGGDDLVHGALPVGVHAVQVQIAPVPAGPPPRHRAREDVVRGPGQRLSVVQGDIDLPGHTGGAADHRPQDDGPSAGFDGPGHVTGSGVRPGEGEPGPFAARPAAEAGRAEDAEVQDARCGVVGGGDGDPLHTGGDVEGDVRPLVVAVRSVAAVGGGHRAGPLAPRRGVHDRRGNQRGGSARGQQGP